MTTVPFTVTVVADDTTAMDRALEQIRRDMVSEFSHSSQAYDPRLGFGYAVMFPRPGAPR